MMPNGFGSQLQKQEATEAFIWTFQSGGTEDDQEVRKKREPQSHTTHAHARNECHRFGCNTGCAVRKPSFRSGEGADQAELLDVREPAAAALDPQARQALSWSRTRM